MWDSSHAYSPYDLTLNFELQLSVLLMQLEHHICCVHLTGCFPGQQCLVCSQDGLSELSGLVEARQYWTHLASHLEEYNQLLPPGSVAGVPVTYSHQAVFARNFGCQLCFDYITHLSQG